MLSRALLRSALGALVLTVLVSTSVGAADVIKVGVSHKDVWDGIFPVTALNKGFFKEQNLDVMLVNAGGGAESVQALTAGSVDIVTPAPPHATLAAFTKGAPVRIIGQQMVGSPDIYWYVKATSPIRTIADLAGRTVTYSRPGSVTHMLLQNLADERKLQFRLVSVGGPPAARTIMMTGQADAAWAAAPFGLDLVQKGEARILFSGNDVAASRNVISRVSISTASFLRTKRDVARRFMIAYAKSLDYVYGENREEVIQWYANENKIPIEIVREAVKYFGNKEQHEIAPLRNFDVAIREAVQFGLIKEVLTEAQLKELVDIVYDPRAR